MTRLTIFSLLLSGLCFASPATAADDDIVLHARKRVETSPGSGRYHAVTEAQRWNPKETAIIVCDMWDLHHCLNAVRRVGEVAPRMNQLLDSARKRGVTIIHAPSDCMETYKDHPGRKRALAAPRAKNLPEDIGTWCKRIPAEGKLEYPIDQTDGGEDDDLEEHKAWADNLTKMGRNPRRPWKSQYEKLPIREDDIVSDKGDEIWNVLEERGIKNVALVGVHTNMCVLGRPFGLRQLSKNGKNVVLVRDMTDTMYNPLKRPFVSHFTGTDLIVHYIEKCVCPTVTSVDFLGGKAFRFSKDTRPRVAIVMAEAEYGTEKTLTEFAKQLGKEFSVELVYANEKDRNDIPGLVEALKNADVLLLSARRRVLPKAQMEAIRAFLAAGKPMVALRTSSHAFSLRNQKPPKGLADWPEFDAEIIGGNYHNHHKVGPKAKISVAEGAAKHPILEGVNVAELVGNGSLYRTSPLKKSATALLIGTIPDKQPEPIAWVNKPKTGNRIFYSSFGHVDDFKEPAFQRLLLNAVRWAAAKE